MTDAERAAILLALADRELSPMVRRAFLEAVQRLLERLPPERDLARLIEAGRVAEAAAAAVPEASTEEAWGGLSGASGEAVRRAAAAAAAVAPTLGPSPTGRGPGLQVRFDAQHPGVVQWLRTWEIQLLRGMTQETREVVTQAIRERVLAGENPLQTARAIPRVIGLTAQQERALANYERALREGDMARAARFAAHDRRRTRPPRDEADLRRMLERFRERQLRRRAETIARTESIRALGAGTHLLWEQQIADGKVARERIRRRWVYTDDARVRHAHRTIPALNPEGVGQGEPFRSELGPIMYPGDPNAPPANTVNCRCTVFVRLLPAAQAAPRPRTPRPPPDPLGLANKDPTERQWHEVAWEKAPKPIRDAVRRAVPLQVFNYAEKGAYWHSALQGGRQPSDLAGFDVWRAHWINMSGYAPGQGLANATWRHEFGHHLDLQKHDYRNGERGRAFAVATKAMAQDAEVIRTAARRRYREEAFQRMRAQVRGERQRAGISGVDTEGRIAWANRELERMGLGGADVREIRPDMPGFAAASGESLVAALRANDPVAVMREALSGDVYLNDFVGALSLNTVGYGHSEEYYRRGRQRDGVFEDQAAEAFANYIEIVGSGSALRERIMRWLAPKTTRAFDRVLSRLAKEDP